MTIEEATMRGIENLTCPLWRYLSPYKHIRLYFMKDGDGKLVLDDHGNPARWGWLTMHDVVGERRCTLSEEELSATDWEEWVPPR
jgi:hypothetical protein